MLQSNHPGESCPTHTHIQYADGTQKAASLVRENTIIRRIRRKLATRGHSLIVTRHGTPARDDLGMFAIKDEHGEVLQRDANLEPLARFLGVLADHETTEPPREPGPATGVKTVEWWEREQQRAQREAIQAVHDAIAQIPILAHLQSEHGDDRLWAQAQGIDMALQANPKWARASTAERFAEVARILEAQHGAVLQGARS